MKLSKTVNKENITFLTQYIRPLFVDYTMTSDLHCRLLALKNQAIYGSLDQEAVAELISACLYQLPKKFILRLENNFYSRCKKWSLEKGETTKHYQRISDLQIKLRLLPIEFLVILYLNILLSKQTYSPSNIELAVKEVTRYISDSIIVKPTIITFSK